MLKSGVSSIFRMELLADIELTAKRASDRVELVAIGVHDLDAWVQVENIAEKSGQFRVAGQDVKDALERIAQFIEGARPNRASLWHSHYHRDEPSRADVDNFPTWAERGIVYHAPTKATIHYSNRGIISSVSTTTPVE